MSPSAHRSRIQQWSVIHALQQTMLSDCSGSSFSIWRRFRRRGLMYGVPLFVWWWWALGYVRMQCGDMCHGGGRWCVSVSHVCGMHALRGNMFAMAPFLGLPLRRSERARPRPRRRRWTRRPPACDACAAQLPARPSLSCSCPSVRPSWGRSTR